jgi:arylsulfatase A-like enzyme
MTQPNFLFILLDDYGWKDSACYGSEFYETPNIDRLRAEGMLFTDAYAACPVCSPTRASILCGKYPARIGVTNFIGRSPDCEYRVRGHLSRGHQSRGRLIDAPYIDHLPLEEKSIAGVLHEYGYSTWHVGKWHLGEEPFWPEKHGFDVNVGGCHWGMPSKGYFSPWGIPTLSDGPDGQCLTDRLGDEAAGLIRGNGQEKPFFLNLCFYAVHTPIQAKEELIRKYEQKARDMGLDKVEALEEGEFFPCEHKRDLRVVRRRIQSDPVYAAMIETVDTNIGKVLDALDESGAADNTAVFFTSDNGGLATAEGSPTCNAPLSEGKGWMYEGGTREPLLVRYPGTVEPGSVSSTPVTSPDFYPTMLELAGLDPMPKQHADGESILPLLKGGDTLGREAIFWHYPHYGNQGGTPGSSVRRGDYKLIEFFEGGRIELYNLEEDIGETKNLVEAEPALARQLHMMLVEWRESVDAIIPEKNPAWEA